MDRAAEQILGGKGAKLSTHGMHVTRTDNKKYLVTHQLRDKNGNPPTDGQRGEAMHSLNSPEELAAHIQAHMPLDNAQEEMNEMAGDK
jgi:hypothetical protein